MKVKICGITRYEDARMALDLGVDALGFNFYRPSPRYIDPGEARSILLRLPPFAIGVGLFVNCPSPEQVEQIARAARVSVLQLHGDESPDYCRELGTWPIIKVLRMGPGPLPEGLDQYPAQAFLLDSKDDARYGGTGKTFDWSRAAAIGGMRPVILAGGLHADNVALAIRTVRPYGIDVCSGVERSPGIKDDGKIEQLMREVRNVAREG